MRNKLEEHSSEVRNIIDTLPVNTKVGRKKKEDFIIFEENINNENQALVLEEIKKRISIFNNLSPNKEIDSYIEKLNAYNVLNDLSEYTSSYEKMHIDRYLKELELSSKEDLKSVNDSLKKIVEAFLLAQINITKEDFDFNNYAAEYMDLIINGASDEELKNKFEEIYWKFPELIRTISINIKSIYIRNEKKIDKYFESIIDKYNKNFSGIDVKSEVLSLNKLIKRKKHTDPYYIFNNFKDSKWYVSNYTKDVIDSKINKYFTEGSYNFENLVSVSNILFEYFLIVKYNMFLNDMKERLEKKEEYKGAKVKALSEITKSEKKLIALNKSSNKRKLFRKNTEKLLFEYNELLNDLINKYTEYDNMCFNDLIYTTLYQDSSVVEILKFISSHYLYFYNEYIESGVTSIDDINREYEELREDINNKEFNMINSIALLDRKQLKEIISNKYKLEGIIIYEEQLEDANIEKTLSDINDIIKYEDIKTSGLSLDDINLYLEIAKITEGK